MTRRTAYLPGSMSGGLGFRPGHWRPDAPTGTPVQEDGGREPPPAPVNSSTGGRKEPSYVNTEIRAREATAANIAAHTAALAPRRWRPPEERS